MKDIRKAYELAMDVEERIYNAVKSEEISQLLENSSIGMCNGACKGFDEDDPNDLCPSCRKEFERLNRITKAKAGIDDEAIAALLVSNATQFNA